MNTYDVNELITYPDCMSRLKELKTFYDFKKENDKKEPPKNTGDWEIVSTMFEVAIEIVSAKLEKREAKLFPINTLLAAEQACSMLLNFSYASDLLTTGFVTYGRGYKRERRFYEFSLENVINLLEEEIQRVSSLNRGACQAPHKMV